MGVSGFAVLTSVCDLVHANNTVHSTSTDRIFIAAKIIGHDPESYRGFYVFLRAAKLIRWIGRLRAPGQGLRKPAFLPRLVNCPGFFIKLITIH